MSVVESAVIFSAVGELTKKISENLELFKKEKDKPQGVKIIQEPIESISLKLKRVTSTSTTKPNTPNIEFKNPLDEEIKVKTISLIPNSSFKTKGIVQVLIDDVEVFLNDAVADFADIASLNIELSPQGKTIKRGKSVQVFIWSPDATSVSLAVTCLFSKVSEN